MKKRTVFLIAIAAIIIAAFLFFLMISGFSHETLTFGPYTCSGKQLAIEQTYNINHIEGVVTDGGLVVTWGDDTFISLVYPPQSSIQYQGGMTESSDMTDAQKAAYLASTTLSHSTLDHASADSVAHEFTINQTYPVDLISTAPVSSQDALAFAACFSAHAKDIYTSIATQQNKFGDSLTIGYPVFMVVYIKK